MFGRGGFYVFHRDVESGWLTSLPGPAGCYLMKPTPNCTLLRDLQATSVLVPRDGVHAYVGRRVFKRDPNTSLLTLLDVRVPEGIKFSPDGMTAYQSRNTLRVYRRNRSGALTLLPQPFGILRGLASERVYPSEITVMPDGKHVYLTGHRTTRVYQVAR